MLSRMASNGDSVSTLKATLKVVLADDHQLMLSGIRRALESDGGFEIVGETQNGAQVLPLVARTKPDLVLLDLRMAMRTVMVTSASAMTTPGSEPTM